MKKNVFYPLFVLLVIATLAIGACAPKSVRVCGEGNVLSENGSDIRCKTDVPASASEVPAAVDNGDQRAVGPQGNEDRVMRLLRLDKVFRSNKSVAAWLEAAGMPYDWTAGYFDARQPEEETLSLSDGSTKIVVSGQQIDVRGLYVAYPSCFTTDQPDRALTTASTLKYTPDPSNGSTLYSNATTSGNGEVTVWVDCSNWSQLADPTNQ